MSRLVILSGPSCIGKGPLCAALREFHPHLAARLQPIVLYNSRAPRPGERDGIDYHFRSRQQIQTLADREGFTVLEARADLQALDHTQLEACLAKGDAFFEGNPYVADLLMAHPLPEGVERMSVFLSPLSREEILELTRPPRNVALEPFVQKVMAHKLLRRLEAQSGGEPATPAELEDIHTRACCAYPELKHACCYDCVIPNHDGEGSEHWNLFGHPIGDARRTLEAVAALLAGRVPAIAEHWEAALIP